MRYLLAALIFIGGCASPEQIAARRQAQQEEFRRGEAAYNQTLRNQCESIGYKADTDPWRQCLIQLHTANQQQNAAARAAIIQGIMQQQQQSYQPPRPRSPTYTNCTRDYWGNVSCISQ